MRSWAWAWHFTVQTLHSHDEESREFDIMYRNVTVEHCDNDQIFIEKTRYYIF